MTTHHTTTAGLSRTARQDNPRKRGTRSRTVEPDVLV